MILMSRLAFPIEDIIKKSSIMRLSTVQDLAATTSSETFKMNILALFSAQKLVRGNLRLLISSMKVKAIESQLPISIIMRTRILLIARHLIRIDIPQPR